MPSARRSSRWSSTRSEYHLRALSARELGSQRRRHRIHAACAPGRDLEQWRRLQRRRRDLQLHALVRQEPPKAIRCPAAWARWSTTRPASWPRRRDHQGRRQHGQAQADQARHLDHSRTSATIPASSSIKTSTRRAAIFKACPIGTGPFELVSYDVGQKVVYKRRENGKWWDGEAYLDGVEFIDYGTDPTADGQRLRGRRGPHQLRDLGRLCVDPRRARPGEVGGRHGGDDRGAHQRHQQAL